jgi:DNA polymerase III subunit epsilon
MKNLEYVILDIETTGFSPKRGDKIVELGALVVNEQGVVVDKFESLVNPQRDLGATWVHKITSEMVKDAPLFGEIAGSLAHLLQGRVVVCHNAKFDLPFVSHELKAALPGSPDLNGVCTLDLSKELFPGLPSYKLQFLAEYFDIGFGGLHAAFEDASVTKELFTVLLDTMRTNGLGLDLRDRLVQFPFEVWTSQGNTDFLRRSDFSHQPATQEGHLQKILKRLPDTFTANHVSIQSYLDILGEALSDRVITENEATQLFELAMDYGISAEAATEIHEEYLRRLVRVYLFDRIISNAEYNDLVKVANILGIPKKLDLIIDLEKSDVRHLQNQEKDQAPVEGHSVCFTGQLLSKLNGKSIAREVAETLAMEKGLLVKHSVSKKLDMLVVSDPFTQSSKAKKAREYGIKIVAEPVFWNLLGVRVE